MELVGQSLALYMQTSFTCWRANAEFYYRLLWKTASISSVFFFFEIFLHFQCLWEVYIVIAWTLELWSVHLLVYDPSIQQAELWVAVSFEKVDKNLGDYYSGTWRASAGSRSILDQWSCSAVTNEHGRCCFSSWYVFNTFFFSKKSWHLDNVINHNCTTFISVPLHVKLKVGRTWGSLEPFLADQHINEVLMPESWGTSCLIKK